MIASALEPRFKALNFLKEEDKEIVFAAVDQELEPLKEGMPPAKKRTRQRTPSGWIFLCRVHNQPMMHNPMPKM